jgi:integrase
MPEQPLGKGRPTGRRDSYTRGIRGFLQWCENEGEGHAAKPPLPRLPRLLLDVLDRDEIDTLEAAGSDRARPSYGSHPGGLRAAPV